MGAQRFNETGIFVVEDGLERIVKRRRINGVLKDQERDGRGANPDTARDRKRGPRT